MHNGGHLSLAPRLVAAARDAGVQAPVVVGGIIPEADVDVLRREGVAVFLTPGASEAEVIAALAAALDDTGGHWMGRWSP